MTTPFDNISENDMQCYQYTFNYFYTGLHFVLCITGCYNSIGLSDSFCGTHMLFNYGGTTMRNF